LNKRILAVAVGLAALPLTVQAAPDLYGKFHISIDKTNDYPAGSVPGLLGDLTVMPVFADEWAVESNSSRLGLRGSEPLFNNDLKAIYQIEVSADIDGDGDTFSTRNSYLGIDSRAGKFFAGNYDSVVKQAEGKIDQFNDTQADIDMLFFGQRRLSDTLNWVSPEMGAITVKVQAAPGEGVGAFGETKDGLLDTFGASVTFAQDNFFAALALERSFFGTVIFDPVLLAPAVVPVIADTLSARASAGIQLDGGVELGAIVEWVEADPQLSGADKGDALSFLLSGKLAASERLDIKAQVGMFDSNDFDTDVAVITAGADYALGKQTKVYGLLSVSDADIRGADDSGNLASVGMVHSF
jgi:predicted porin